MFFQKGKSEYKQGIQNSQDCEFDLVKEVASDENRKVAPNSGTEEEVREKYEKTGLHNRAITIICRIILILGIGITLLTWVTDLFLK